MRSSQSGLASHVDTFHTQRPGITEDVLARCTDPNGVSPYPWLTDGLERQTQVADLACRDGPSPDHESAPIVTIR